MKLSRQTRLAAELLERNRPGCWTGPAFVHVAGKRATDDVAFGEPGDLVLRSGGNNVSAT